MWWECSSLARYLILVEGNGPIRRPQYPVQRGALLAYKKFFISRETLDVAKPPLVASSCVRLSIRYMLIARNSRLGLHHKSMR